MNIQYNPTIKLPHGLLKEVPSKNFNNSKEQGPELSQL